PDLPGHIAEIDEAALCRLFLKESHDLRDDADPESTSRSGFVLGLWNGASISVTMQGGAYSRHLRNSLKLTFDRTPDLASARTLMTALVAATEPDWATICDRALRDAQTRGPDEPVVGWLTYYARSEVSALPAGVSAEPLGAGTLVISEALRPSL